MLIQGYFKTFLNRLAHQSSDLYVIGNGSVDYDSFFGSIVLAYILTEASGFLHVPLIDCSRSDLNLRFEIIAVLDKLKINPNVFQFRSNPTEPYPKGKFSLYDHNEREDLKEELSYIVDHHAYSIEKVAKTKHLINQMGSALTILYDLLNPASINQVQPSKSDAFKDKLEAFISSEPFNQLKSDFIFDDDIKEIILYGILLDTFNFDENQKERWTPYDKTAYHLLSKTLQGNSRPLWHFQELLALKYNEEANKKLTAQQQLAKDRKIFNYGTFKCIYSSVLLSTSTFYHHYKDLDIYTEDCDLYIIMSAFQNEKREYERELLYKVRANNSQIIENNLQNCMISLNQKSLPSFNNWRRWKDPSVTLSRKILQPIIRKIVQSIKL